MGNHAGSAELVVKKVGATGQISLGKEFAGRQVMIELIEEGEWRIREVLVIPRNEQIFHTPEAQASLARAVEWIEKNPTPRAATSADIDALEQELFGGKARKTAAKKR